MSDDKNNRNYSSDDDFNYDDYSLDNYRYDEDEKFGSYDDYNDDPADEKPLTSTSRSYDAIYDDEPTLEREQERTRPSSRRETIGRVAEDVQRGIPRKPGVTAPDTRLTSAYSNRKNSGSRRTQSNRPPRTTHHRPQKSGSNKALFAGFYIAFLMLAIGLVLVLLIFAIGRSSDMLENMPFFSCSDPAVPNYHVNQTPAEPLVHVDMSNRTAMILGIDPFGEMRTLTLLDITTRITDDFNVPEDAQIVDRRNDVLTFGELRVGNIIDISYDRNTSNIAALNESRQAWTRPGRTNVQIDIENFSIALGNESWAFNSQTLVLYRGEPFSIGQVRPINSVTLRGQGDTVWLVQVDAAHGFLQFTNADMIANARVMIGTNIILGPDDIGNDIDLAEGSHRLMIEGDNIETFIDDIVIQQGQTTRFNLGDLPLRAAILNIAVTPADAIIFVNGEEHDNSEPAQVAFGENLVRVEREGFLPQEQQLDISQPINFLTFELSNIVHENTLVIFTDPQNAEIFVNDVFVGHSPHTQPIGPGQIAVVARLPGHTDARTNITVTGYETEDIMRHLMLSAATGDPFQGQPPHHVDPVNTPAPFPTLPPVSTPNPNPPGHTGDPFPTPTPTPMQFPDFEIINPTPMPTPFPITTPVPTLDPFPDFEIIDPSEPWWLSPPAS